MIDITDEQEKYIAEQIIKAKKYESLADYSKFLEEQCRMKDAQLEHIRSTKGHRLLQKLYGVKHYPVRVKNRIKRVITPSPRPTKITYTDNKKKLRFKYAPLISVIMPVYNVKKEYLIAAIESVINQSYQNWELCIVDDCSSKAHVKRVLKHYDGSDPRIKIQYSNRNLHIAGASNLAIKDSEGDYIAFLDDDDVLRSDALEQVVKYLNENKDCEALYSDNYIINENNNVITYMIKPDFSPELFLTTSYMVHLCVFSSRLIKENKGLNEDRKFRGTQDIEIKVRLISEGIQFGHIQKPLYYWRASDTSTARTFSNKDGMSDNSINAFKLMLKSYYKNNELTISMPEDAKAAGLGYYELELKSLKAKVLLVVHVESANELNYNLIGKVRSIMKDSGFETIVLCKYGTIKSNYYSTYNLRKGEAIPKTIAEKYDYCLFLDGNIREIDRNSLLSLFAYMLLTKEVAVVGGKVCSSDDRIQEGAYLFMNNLQIMHAGCHRYATLTERYAQNVMAVSWKYMIIRAEDFGEFIDCLSDNNEFPDVEFCIRQERNGKRVVYNPRAEVKLNELYRNSTVWNMRKPEYKALQKKYSDCFGKDPFYSSAYSNKYQFTIVNKVDESPK